MRSVPPRDSGGSVSDEAWIHLRCLLVKLLGVDSCAAKESPRQTHRYRVVVLTSSRRCVNYMTTDLSRFSGRQNLAPGLFAALRPLPKTTRNLNGQAIAELAGEHDNLPAMMTFMSDEIT
jgi:hypothetical protein